MRAIGLTALVAVLVASLSAVAVRAEGQDEKTQTKQGAVKSVDVAGKKIVVTVARDLTFTLTDNTKITQGDKAIALSDIKVGCEVKVEYFKKGDEDRVATKIEVVAEKAKEKANEKGQDEKKSDKKGPDEKKSDKKGASDSKPGDGSQALF